MPNLTCVTSLQGAGPWRPKAIRNIKLLEMLVEKLLYALILLESTLLFISTALQDIHMGLII